ncbi:MAG TPA: response regulator [Candidatus Krumholzibacteria bacterium]|nr:response regulator [Candidatus Krumholzibacteria bacterium]
MGRTVLIVDDAEFMRLMLREIVADLGLAVVAEAGDGFAALSAWRRTRPDLVLMDISMPNMDGIAAVRAIRGDDPSARIVMIGALGQKDEVLDAVKAGACDFIVKPFDHERVRETLARVLAAVPA